MFQQLIAANGDWTGLALRLTAGLILFPHGAQKLLGWFGGYGFSGTMNFFTQTKGLPWLIVFLVIVIEFAGALSLVVGFASRVWALLLIFLMLGIIISSHLPFGFFIDWNGTQKGEGYEFHLLFIGLCVALILSGSGRFSVDAWLGGRV